MVMWARTTPTQKTRNAQHSETCSKLRKWKRCSVSDVEEDELVYIPPFQRDHTSWPEFERSLKKYIVKRRNASLKSQIQYVGIPEKDIPLVPQEADPYQRKYIFTHG
ncbi:hypothetical protein PHPALM_28071 [Phytophthora palmivora]|uniref:Uncharacterized protein n=1 Tax=Phytophthora palmivora TaxID=4796 RepID=A0A2P4XAZ7_9STRA|nr:hypothetical protein PHPALM_28071 [Phytophthora palmivora]